MTGGEIFHEMMLRQGVKHICMYTEHLTGNGADHKAQSDTLVAPFSPSSMPSTTRNTSTLSSPNMNKVLDTWPRVMRERLDSLALFS